MNKIKRMLCIVMSLIMALLPALFAASAEDGGAQLQFGSDGKFKIMMFADIQDNEELEETTLAMMNESLDRYQPDFVVYLGDNTVAQGYDNQYTAIKNITEPCVSRNIPYSIVFGNHDQEQGVEKEDLLEIYREFGCMTYDAAPEIYGCGNCNFPVLSSDGSRIAFNLWMTDSGSKNHDTPEGGYDFVREDQIQWYKDTAAALKAANGGKTVPAVNFQHIVVPEVYDALGYPQLPVKIGDEMTFNQKNYLKILPSFGSHSGFIFEWPCPPYLTEGQFDAWVQTGDIVASFFGHDHTNSFSVNHQGIDLVAVPTVGCNSYSSELNRGVGLLTLDENDPENYSYELIHLYDMALAENSTIPAVDGGQSRLYYHLVKMFSEVLEYVHDMIRGISPMPMKGVAR